MQLAWCHPKKPLQYIYYIHGLWPLYYCHDMNWQFHQLDLAGFMHGKTGSQVLVIHERLKTFTYRERFSCRPPTIFRLVLMDDPFASVDAFGSLGIDDRTRRQRNWEMDKLNDQTNTRWVRWFFPCIWIHFIIHLVYLKLVAGYCLMIV